MFDLFSEAPQGIQPAPGNVALAAAGHQVRVRTVTLERVHNLKDLMYELVSGLALDPEAGEGWEGIYRGLIAADLPEKNAALLCGYSGLRRRLPGLAADLERILLEAQRTLAGESKALWLLEPGPQTEPAAL